jgi:carboxymethylenebutenolidase
MRRLTVFAGSTVAATSVLSKLQLDYSSADTTAYAADEIETKYIEYDSNGKKIKGYLAAPKKNKKRAGVVIIHENRGLNPHIEDVARRAALAGFTALAPDGLSPLGNTPSDPDAARDLIGKLEAPVALQLFKDGLKYLRELPKATGKTGCVGFCWGGAMANNLAVNDPELNAAVAFYGRQAAAADVPKIKAALMLHYGALDERVNAGIPAYEAALKEHNKEYQVFIYEGANHAFHNDTAGPRYDEKAAKLAWGRTIAFFEEKLK